MKINLFINILGMLGLIFIFCSQGIANELLIAQDQNENTKKIIWCKQMLDHVKSVEQKQRECFRLQNNIHRSDQSGGFSYSTNLNCDGFDRQLEQISADLMQQRC